MTNGVLTKGPATGAAVLEALGEPTRRAIFERLAEHPAAVGELAAGLPVTRPAVSQHLRVLKDAGLVVAEPAGTRRIYRIEPSGIDALRAYLDRFWTGALRSFQAAVEDRPDPTEEP
jgi:DNA-binding transcriptional ArsR family regulator